MNDIKEYISKLHPNQKDRIIFIFIEMLLESEDVRFDENNDLYHIHSGNSFLSEE